MKNKIIKSKKAVPKPTVDTSSPTSITPPVFTQAPSMSN